MSDINPEFVERYQILYDRDPKSKVFAPLAEAYRKMGLTNKAFLLCKAGLQHHPNFAGGHLALSRALLSLEEPKKALEHLEKTVELSPENILAYQLLGETNLQLKRPKEALKAYKMLLFLSPDNKKALKAVAKLESLTADEFDKNIFSTRPWELEQNQPPPVPVEKIEARKSSEMQRYLSLIDAYVVRNDLDKALEVYQRALSELGPNPELQKKLQLIKSEDLSEEETELPTAQSDSLRTGEIPDDRVHKLRKALFSVNNRRKDVIED